MKAFFENRVRSFGLVIVLVARGFSAYGAAPPATLAPAASPSMLDISPGVQTPAWIPAGAAGPASGNIASPYVPSNTVPPPTQYAGTTYTSAAAAPPVPANAFAPNPASASTGPFGGSGDLNANGGGYFGAVNNGYNNGMGGGGYFDTGGGYLSGGDLGTSNGALPGGFPGVAARVQMGASIVNTILGVGRNIWGIVQMGHPVVNAATDNFSALPAGFVSWEQLGNWQPIRSVPFRTTLRNKFGRPVVDFAYAVHFMYGGGVGGHGRFLTGVGISVDYVRTAAYHNFSAVANVPSLSNVGTAADPIAQVELRLYYKLDTPGQVSEYRDSFQIRGDGDCLRLPTAMIR